MNYWNAFWVGGAICAICQIFIDRTKLTPARILVSLVVLGVFLQAVGVYQPLVDYAGAGAPPPSRVRLLPSPARGRARRAGRAPPPLPAFCGGAGAAGAAPPPPPLLRLFALPAPPTDIGKPTALPVLPPFLPHFN